MTDVLLNDIDIRPVPIDKLTDLKETELSSRRTRIEAHVSQYETHIAELEETLERCKEIYTFLQRERDAVILAQKLQSGDIVRVVCPTCQGTGMKPTDVLSGRIKQSGSAFESKKAKPSREIDPALRCTDCEGKRWLLMDRFKG